MLFIRSIRNTEYLFKKLGLIDLEFIPFEMPFDIKLVNDAITLSKKSTYILLPNLRSHTLKQKKDASVAVVQCIKHGAIL